MSYLVEFPAVGPNLTHLTRQGPYVSHLNHRPTKIPPKLTIIIGTIFLHQLIRFAAAKQRLVGLQKASLGHQVVEIARVEAGGSLIQRKKVGVAAGLRAGDAFAASEAAVDVDVIMGGVVNAGFEEGALRKP